VVWKDHTLNVDEVRMYCPDCGAAGPPVELEKRADDEEARKAAEAALALWERRVISPDDCEELPVNYRAVHGILRDERDTEQSESDLPGSSPRQWRERA
jgi:hypothetical protein